MVALIHYWRRAMTVIAGVAAVAALGYGHARPAAAGGLPGRARAARLVSAQPASGTPELAQDGDTPERVRQIVQCGATMFAVGSFTKIEWSGRVYDRSNIFSFSARAPFTVSGWNPDVNGAVNSIAFDGSRCVHAYIGGKFTVVHGTPARDVAEISTSTGAVVTAFAHHANGQVETLISASGHIIAGGYYTSISDSTADPYMTSLNPVTGQDDGYLHLHIAGSYQFPGASANATRVYNQQLSHSGTLDLVEGDFTSVGGLARQQVFMLKLGSEAATVTGWTSAAFDQHCVDSHPFYIQAGAWSPDDSTVYLAATGFHPADQPPSGPRSGLCDSAAAYPATHAPVNPTWINYTGCWSLYTTAADSAAVYIGGHEEYANNPDGCKTAGPGAVPDPGLGGLSRATGHVLLDARGTAGLYSRSRGSGADDMLLTRRGLWVASDNGVYADGTFHLSDTCGRAHGHAGICFLPYTGAELGRSLRASM
jgi:hypothetical protein